MQLTTILQSTTAPPTDDNACPVGRTMMQGDFSRGQRHSPREFVAAGDFAIGQRRSVATATVGTFATGMRSTFPSTTVGDFASGMRTILAAQVTEHDLTDADATVRLAA